MRLSIGHKLTLAFAAAVAILLATAVVSYRNTRELLATADGAATAQEVLGVVDQVADAMRRVEVAARAIPSDGEGGGYAEAAREVKAAVARLSSRALGDSARRARSSRLTQLVDERLQVLEVIATGGSSAAAAVGRDRGVSPSDDGWVAAIAEWRGIERERVRAQSAAAHAGADRAEFILRFGVILVLILAPLAFFIVRNDFAVRQEAERALGESEARFRAATDGSLDAFYVLRAMRDANGEVLDFEFVDLNARAESLLSHSRDEVLGQRLCELIPANRTLGFVEKYRRVMESGVVLEEECEVTSRDYHAAWIHHQVVPLVDGVAITSRDITERKRQEDALRALSLVDELTGLYNRRGFLTLAQQQLKLARRGHRELVLLFIDMDDFKEINDTFGHTEGDVALTRAAEVLKHTFRDSDIIARLGGDEFVVLATDTGKTGSEVIVHRLRQELLERNERDGYPYRLSFSVGAARFDPDAPPSIEELLAAADAMLYEQKRHKRQTTPSAA